MVAAAIVAGAVITGGAAAYTGNQQSKAAKGAANAQSDQYYQTRLDQEPYREAGYKALDLMNQGTAPGGYFTHQFNSDDLDTSLAPNYQFMLDQGQKANQNAAGVAGGLVGGNALKGLQDYTQNYAQNAYQQAFQNYTANQTNIYNRLSNLAGLGQTANQATSNAGQSAALNAGNFLTSGAAASAAGIVGAGSAANSGLGNYIGWQYMNGAQSSPNDWRTTGNGYDGGM